MGIADEDVAAVRAASDIVGIVSQYLQLRRVGRRWQGLCPFHTERTPSFSVNADEGLWYCFGCQASGDVITFVREVEKLDFVGAVEWLASKAGVTLHYTDRNEGETRKRRTHLLEVMAKAVDWYHERLLSSPDAGAARSYLRARGLDGDVVREYRIGWAPDGWDELCRGLHLSENAAKDTGLGFRNSRNRLQDTFRARVMFPIFDPQGNPVSFGGRILPGADDPRNHGKYKNTPETPLYHKSKVLYGMDRAKAGMVGSDSAVICEGYTDVIGFQRSGVPTAVATCGTALTDEHVKLLRRYAKRLVLAFDADGAGQAAAERFYQWEREHGLEVVVADLPEGMDPADVAQSDPERLVKAVDQATPFMRFRLDRVFAGGDVSTPEGRARTAEAALALVAEHPDVLVQDQYLMDVAGRCRIDPERLRPQLAEVGRRQRRRPAPGQPGRQRQQRPQGGSRRDGQPSGGPREADEPPHPADVPHPADAAELDGGWSQAGAGRHDRGRGPGARDAGDPRDARDNGRGEGPAWEVLRHAVHNPGDVAPWLHGAVEAGDAVFANSRHRQILQSLVEADTLSEAIERAEQSADPGLADLLRRLSVEEPQSEPFGAVCRLLSEVARRELDDLRYVAASLADPSTALTDSAFLSRCIDELRSTDTAVAAAEGLLAWLRQRVGDGG